MSTAPTDPQGMSDAELIASVRAGSLECYGTLYERHVAAAYNLARQLARTSIEADDLVSDAFSKVLDTLRGGKGPDSAFRAYLLTAVRHGAYDKTRRDKKLDLADDMTTVTTVGGAGAEALTVEFSDTAVEGLERTLAARAFATLPERWQAVLWHTEIEGQSPAEVAPLLGLTANGVSALAYRAREGLRQAYLQVHLAEVGASRCRATAEKLGAWTRDGLSKRERAQVETHLDECSDCQALAAELADVNGALRAVVAPLVLGGGVLGYLALAGSGKAAAATAVGAAAAGGSAGGAAGAAASAPRQFAGVAGSGVAMAAAVAVALTAGGASQQIPAAAERPEPPAAQAPNQPAPPNNPPPGQPAPDSPPDSSDSPDSPPAEQPPAPDVSPAPQPSPEPEPASVSAVTPPEGVELVAGGSPVDLPITVTNDGGTLSDPIDVTLNLPNGVSSLGSGGGGSAPQAARTAEAAPSGGGSAPAGGAPRQAGGERITCPAGTGTVTCSTGRGLEPSESATLVFRLQASEDAESGQVTGSISDASGVNVSLQVPVEVAPQPAPEPPPEQDGVVVQAQRGWGHGAYVTVRNTGDTEEAFTLTSDRWAHKLWADHRVSCSNGFRQPLSCTSTPLEPGEHVHLYVLVPHFGKPHEAEVTFTATLGDAADSAYVSYPCLLDCLDEWITPSDSPTATTSESPDTTDTTEPTETSETSESSESSESSDSSETSGSAPPGTTPSERPTTSESGTGSATQTTKPSGSGSGTATMTRPPSDEHHHRPPWRPWPRPHSGHQHSGG